MALSNHVKETVRFLRIKNDSVILQFAPPQFDVCISDIFCALYAGATLRLMSLPEVQNMHELRRVFATDFITHASLPPAILQHISPEDAPSLQLLNLGGEVATRSQLQRWSRVVPVMISYGPSEATIATSCCRWMPGRNWGQ